MDSEKDKQLNIPKHVAVIADGNRRWARSKGLPELMGHKKGAENLEQLLRDAKDMGIETMTFWFFSTENWKRSKEEVKWLMDLFREFIDNNKERVLKEGIRFIHLGRKDRLPEDILKRFNDLEEESKHNTEYTFAFAIDYGGHDEIVRAVNKLIENNEEVNEENIEKNLDTQLLPPVDLIIRTSGEQRLSGFMSWQTSYAELYFPTVHFPDFNKEELQKAVHEYSRRNRRFGGN